MRDPEPFIHIPPYLDCRDAEQRLPPFREYDRPNDYQSIFDAGFHWAWQYKFKTRLDQLLKLMDKQEEYYESEPESGHFEPEERPDF